MKILIEPGCWLADDLEGDPGRTCVEGNATEYETMGEAVEALKIARKYRPLKNATIMDDFV